MKLVLRVCLVAGGGLVALGCGLLWPPVGLIVLGVELGAAGLLVDDGS